MLNSPIHNVVSFKNSQNEEAQGTLLSLHRSSVALEIYNPYSIVQLSEVLNDLRIRRGDETIYQGKAVVSNLVNTGLMIIVSATLVDGWTDLTGILEDRHSIKKEVHNFVETWEQSHQINKGYQVAVAETRSFLNEMSRWLEQIDVFTIQNPQDENLVITSEVFEEILQGIYPKLETFFFQFEAEAAKINEDELLVHRNYAQRDLHPLLMRAPFAHRSFHKPLGYAGDYEMVNMMFRGNREGPTVYAQLINYFYTNVGPADAHQQRVKILEEWLTKHIQNSINENKPLKILNIGCGPAIEIQQLIKNGIGDGRCQMTLLDFSEETLEYTKGKISAAKKEYNSEINVNYIHESVHHLLRKGSQQNKDDLSESYDLIYCAGLFDYLSDKVCSRLLSYFNSIAKAEGEILATNVHPNNPVKYSMEHLLEWYLIYRNEKQMDDLIPANHPREVFLDKSGFNIFLKFPKTSS